LLNHVRLGKGKKEVNMERIIKYVFEKLMVRLFVKFGKEYPEIIEWCWNDAAYHAKKYPPLVEYNDEEELVPEEQLYFFGQYLQIILQVLASKLGKPEQKSTAEMFDKMVETCDWTKVAEEVAIKMNFAER
jgi:hypothetical protein